MAGYLNMKKEDYIDKNYPNYIHPDLIITCPRQKIECIKNEDFPYIDLQYNLDPHAIKCSTCFIKPTMYLSINFYCNFCFPCFIKMLYEQQSDITNPVKVMKYKLFIGISNSIMLDVNNAIKNYLEKFDDLKDYDFSRLELSISTDYVMKNLLKK